MKAPKAVEPSRREESIYQRLLDNAMHDLLFDALGVPLMKEIRLDKYVPGVWKRGYNDVVHHRGR